MYTDDIYVKDTVDKYKEVDPVLMEKISKLVRKKFDDKEWDIARTDDDQDLTTMFIFEYAKTMESNIPGITGELSWERTYLYSETLKNIFAL